MRLVFTTIAGLFAVGAALAQDGTALYATHCVACHQAGGQGAPGVAPPLAGNVARHAASVEGHSYLVRVPLTGMVGTITVDGVRYLGNNMPSFASLGDAEIAAVVAHVLRDFNGVSDVAWLTSDFVASVRKAGGTPNETHKLRGKLLMETGGK